MISLFDLMQRVFRYPELAKGQMFDLETMIVVWRVQELQKLHPNYFTFTTIDKRMWDKEVEVDL